MLEKGDLKDFKLADLINIISQGRKSGEIKINSNEQEVVLYFLEGSLVHAKNASGSGEEVVYELMNWNSGDFEFYEKDTNVNKTISKDTDELIREGTFRLEIVNQLMEKSIKFGRNSIISLANVNKSAETSSEQDYLLKKIKNSQNNNIVHIALQTNFSAEKYSEVILSLLNSGYIKIIKSEEEIFWGSFQQLVNALYSEFTSISGLKMSKDLDIKIKDLIKINSWSLGFKDGKIYSSDLSHSPVNKQWEIYRVFLNELLEYFIKVYGDSFINKVFNRQREINPEVDVLINKLNKFN